MWKNFHATWISDYTYTNILARINSIFGGAGAPRPASVHIAAASSYFIVRGTIDLANNQTTFAPFGSLSANNPETPPAGDFLLRSLNANTAVLQEVSFEPSQMSPNYPTPEIFSEEVRMRLTGHSSREKDAKHTHINVEPLKHAIDAMPILRATP